MSLWYYLVKGQPQGPVTLDEIKREIAANRLGAKDLLYQDHDTRWREARSFAELSGHFEVVSSQDGWVLLVRKLDGSGYRQRGPFSDQQIISLLKNGEISFTDYVWRKGLKEWYKILALPEFNQAFAAKEKILPPLPVEPELTVDLSEITMKLPMPEDSEETVPNKAMPVEEKRSDLKPEIKKHIVRTKKKKKGDEGVARRVGIVNYYLSLNHVYRTLFVVGVILVLGSLLTVVTYFSTYIDRKNFNLKNPQGSFVTSNLKTEPHDHATARLEPDESSRSAKPSIPEKVVEPPNSKKTTPAPAPKVEERVAPTYLKYAKIAEGEENAKLKIISNASSHFSIYVIFTGLAGQVLDAKSIQKKIKLPKSVDERVINLATSGLPPGSYSISIESQELKVKTDFDYATKSADFKKKLNHQRKLLTYYHNEERQSFIKTVSRLEKEAFKLAQNVENASSLNSWSGFYKSWRKNFERIQNPNIKKISSRNRNTFVHAEMWYQLKDLQKTLDQEAKSVNRAKSKGQSIEAGGIKTAALSLTKLKERMLRESLWR
ncbi:MAG: DUF4339 domain-containing protein [Bdellovibrionales bacterium]|nr:DUF4339 domain-containing protein [Bdellovibrionales bacterium]